MAFEDPLACNHGEGYEPKDWREDLFHDYHRRRRHSCDPWGLGSFLFYHHNPEVAVKECNSFHPLLQI